MSAKSKTANCQIVGSGGVCAKVTTSKGVVTAVVNNPCHQLGVLVVDGNMYVRLVGHRRVFHAAYSHADTVTFTRLTKTQRGEAQQALSKMELTDGQQRMLRMIFYGEVAFD